ncbi:MAG: hypothetical protein AAGF12_20095 [Myxococcota bacterium]
MPLVLALGLLWPGCIERQAFDITGLTCPCGEGFECDTATNQCVRPGQTPPPPQNDSSTQEDATVDGPADDADTDGMVMMDAMVDAMPSSDRIWIEAESGTITAPMGEENAQAGASGGAYVTVAAGTATNGDPDNTAGGVTYEFMVTEAGDYRVWGRIITPEDPVEMNSDSNDSFWVRVNGGAWSQWNNTGPFLDWDWDLVHNTTMMADEVQTYSLMQGMNTMEVRYREDGPLLDKWVITSDNNFTPMGQGD